MKIFKIDDNYLDFELPETLASQVGIDNIYFSDIDKRKKMFAIINMVNKNRKNNEILSWEWNRITISNKDFNDTKIYHYENYLLLDNYLFEVYNYMDVKMAKRYYKIIKLKERV